VYRKYIPNSTEEILERLKKAVSVGMIEDLFSDIPKRIRLKKPLKIPQSISEYEVIQKVEKTLEKNRTVKELTSFLGGGAWSHFVPSVVDAISLRSEFMTSYTPYQPEISQGILQALFEYQSMICELLDMEIANCSMYDWASSLGEAARMAARVTNRTEFLVPHYLSPERMAVLKAYAEPAGIKVLEIKQTLKDGQLDLEDLKEKTSENTAGVYIENPSYLGFLTESTEAISEVIHDVRGLFIVGVDPTSLGILRPPGDYGADITIGEGQPLGNYMNDGGPFLGILACRNEEFLVRQIPGRIVGMTTTQDQKERAFCMILQTREQHIRRHKATSNICTNESLCALRAAVYMALLGPKGFEELGQTILSKTYYVMRKLSMIEGLCTPLFEASHFKEFTVNFNDTSKTVQEANRKLLEKGIVGGKPLDHEFPELGQTALYCVTELHSLEEIERLQESLKEILEV
jgi:glycine dehydrogenase subunit 1